MLRPILPGSGAIVAEGKVLNRGSRTALAEATLRSAETGKRARPRDIDLHDPWEPSRLSQTAELFELRLGAFDLSVGCVARALGLRQSSPRPARPRARLRAPPPSPPRAPPSPRRALASSPRPRAPSASSELVLGGLRDLRRPASAPPWAARPGCRGRRRRLALRARPGRRGPSRPGSESTWAAWSVSRTRSSVEAEAPSPSLPASATSSSRSSPSSRASERILAASTLPEVALRSLSARPR